MTDISGQMFLVMIAWLGLVLLVTRQVAYSREGSVGLPIAFLLALTFFYCGAFAYVVPGYTHLRGDGDLYLQSYRFTERTVLTGAVTTLIGVAGFAIGALVRIGGARPSAVTDRRDEPSPVPAEHQRRLITVLGAAAVAGFLLNGLNIPLPLIQAVSQVLRNAAVSLVCLGCALAILNRRSQTPWILLGAAIPAVYLVVWGFTSYGLLVLIVFAGFWLAVTARRKFSLASITGAGAAAYYLLLSVFVAWMSFRDELRRVLWSSAGLGERLGAIAQAFGGTVLLSPFNFRSLDLINTRLSQTIFIGKAVALQEAVPSLRQNGKTIVVALFAFIPRFVWPDKPTMQQTHFLAENTGLIFSGAAFGTGPVFELFVNFGQVGVFVGSIVLGWVVRSVDVASARALRERRLMDHVRWFTVGLAFIAPLTNLFFMVNTAIMSWLVLTALKFIIESPGRAAPRGAT